MSDKEWLQNLKVGDKVILHGSGMGRYRHVGKVSRFTNNFIVVESGSNKLEHKFRKESGRETGDGWHHYWLEEATSEKIADIILKGEQFKVKGYVEKTVNWSIVPADVIDRVYMMLDPFVKEDKNV